MDISKLPRPLTKEQAAEEEAAARHEMHRHVTATRSQLTGLDLKREEAGDVPYGLS